jgi:hypothetical protein
VTSEGILFRKEIKSDSTRKETLPFFIKPTQKLKHELGDEALSP